MPLEPEDAAVLPAVDPARLSPEALRTRLANPPAWSPELTGDRFRLRADPPRAAAVLVPIIAHDSGPTVLLTERTTHLYDHAGQIAFPGGRRDEGDRDDVATALREAHEEIGLDPGSVDVLAQLPTYLTGTGYLVTAVVGLVRPGQQLRLDSFEVAQAFEVPLAFLMDPRCHQRRRVVIGEIERTFYAMPYCVEGGREFFIWGATAAMLRNLYRMLSA
ncbi:MAG: CoA pyrophosphatase [Burkholderiaceae bacterium]|nr:CoA pyrophosphatase [Burkholderiaceae bacterium]